MFSYLTFKNVFENHLDISGKFFSRKMLLFVNLFFQCRYFSHLSCFSLLTSQKGFKINIYSLSLHPCLFYDCFCDLIFFFSDDLFSSVPLPFSRSTGLIPKYSSLPWLTYQYYMSFHLSVNRSIFIILKVYRNLYGFSSASLFLTIKIFFPCLYFLILLNMAAFIYLLHIFAFCFFFFLFFSHSTSLKPFYFSATFSFLFYLLFIWYL